MICSVWEAGVKNWGAESAMNVQDFCFSWLYIILKKQTQFIYEPRDG